MHSSWKAIGLAAVLGTGVTYSWLHSNDSAAGPTAVYAQQKADAQQAQSHLMASADQLSAAFREVAKSLKPAVVSIRATVEAKVERRGNRRPSMPPMFRDFEDFFGEGFEFNMPEQRGGESQGSGFIVSDDGYILTNNHVVAGADKISVNLSDNRTFEAQVVGTDPDSDLAVIKINAKDLAKANLGDSDAMQEGDWVIAIGSPFGLKHTVTAGIVSALNRNSVDGGHSLTNYDNFIQTDAAINPGNSGGPLMNLKGEVIGINTAIASGSGRFDGVGFAIPSNMAKNVFQDLVGSGRVIRGFLGAGLRDITPELVEQQKLSTSVGVMIDQVFDDGPAAKAGLQPSDIITSINGKQVSNVANTRIQIASMKPGEKAQFELVRDGKPMKITVTIEEQTKDKLAAMSGKRVLESLGIEVAELSKEDAMDLGIRDGGVLVVQVERNSPLARNLKVGEAIISVNRVPVKSVKDFVQAVSQSKNGIQLVIRNSQSTRVLTIQ